MSTLTDKAKAEAEEVEAENPDGDEAAEEADKEAAEEAQLEEKPETPAAPRDDVDADAIMGKVVTRATNYMKAIVPMVESVGAGFQPCPMCEIPGITRPRTEYEVPSDQVAAILAMIGRVPEPEYPESNQYERCAECDGWGEVLTGAQKPISRTAVCNPCGGKGFKPVIQVYAQPAAQAAAPFPGAAVPFAPLPSGTPDAWRRPAGHPHWGLDPALVGSPNGQQVG